MPYPGIEDIFDEQIADTFEVGAKGDLVDGKVRLSAALYHTTLGRTSSTIRWQNTQNWVA